LIWCSLPCLCMFHFDMVFLTVFVYVSLWYGVPYRVCVRLTLIWCSLPCLCMFDFDMVFLTVFVYVWLWYGVPYRVCVCLTLIWCSLPCLCMFDFDMVSLPCLFVTIFVSLQHFTKTVTDVTFRIDGECLCNCAIKSARWQHPAMRHWARFAVLSTTCFTGFTSCLCFILGLRLNTDRCWFSI